MQSNVIIVVILSYFLLFVPNFLAYHEKYFVKHLFYRRQKISLVFGGVWHDRGLLVGSRLYIGAWGGRQQQFFIIFRWFWVILLDMPLSPWSFFHYITG